MLLATASAAAGTWQASVNEFGLREASGSGLASLAGVEATAQLTLRCQPASDGALSWSLAIEDSSMLAFGFDAFEGPDAPAADSRHGALTVVGGLLQPRFSTAMAGFYQDAGRFVFEFSAPALAASDGALLADSIDRQSRALEWRISDHADPGKVLLARFELVDAAAPINETMMGCGPQPAISTAQRAGWVGTDPLASGLLEQRALAWRLKGLLGRDFDRLRARLAGAAPVGLDGETLYILAADPLQATSGVALMFDASATEVVLIDQGVVDRRASGTAAIWLPAAVRDFVAARTQPTGP
jgi:hypothetical protein